MARDPPYGGAGSYTLAREHRRAALYCYRQHSHWSVYDYWRRCIANRSSLYRSISVAPQSHETRHETAHRCHDT